MSCDEVQVVEIADVITPVQEHAFEVGKRTTVAGLRDLPEVHLRLLEAPVTAVLGTVNPGGTAQLTPVWCNHEGATSISTRSKDVSKIATCASNRVSRSC